MNTPTAHPDTPTETLETHCPRCGRKMALRLPVDYDRDDAQRLAKLVLCRRCCAARGIHHAPEPQAVRLPYVD